MILVSSTLVWALQSISGGKGFSVVIGVAVLVGFALLARRVVRYIRQAAAPMGELIEVVGNLMSNAMRHTPRGGRVALVVTVGQGGQTLAVTDTGTGMEPEEVARAFDRFWRSGSSPGAGLGLAIVRDLVAAHGGEVEIRSVPGDGTTVLCRFPHSA